MNTQGIASKSILLILVGAALVAVIGYYCFRAAGYFDTITVVEVSSVPSGALVLVDSKPVGKTPLTINDLEPGGHDFDFILSGYRKESRSVLCIGKIEVQCELEEMPKGSVNVVTVPGGARVFLNGLEKGVTPLSFFVEPGIHNVSLLMENYDESLREITVEDGSETNLEVELVASVESFYIKSIKNNPYDLLNYCDLMRYFYVKERYPELGKLIYDGFEAYFSGKADYKSWDRFKQEITKVRDEDRKKFIDEIAPSIFPYAFEAANKYPGRQEVFEVLLVNSKKVEESVELIKNLIKKYPDEYFLRIFIATQNRITKKYFYSLSDEDFAREAELVLNPGSLTDKEKLFSIYEAFGKTCLSLGRCEMAARSLTMALDNYVDEIGITRKQKLYYHLIVSLQRSEQLEEAKKLIEEILTQDGIEEKYKNLYKMELRRIASKERARQNPDKKNRKKK